MSQCQKWRIKNTKLKAFSIHLILMEIDSYIDPNTSCVTIITRIYLCM